MRVKQTGVILFGRYGVLDYDPAEDVLLCHQCGGWYRNLAQHARLTHNLLAAEYRALAGLNRQTRLVSARMRQRLREVSAPVIARLRAEGRLRNWKEDPERWRRDKAAAEAVLREGMRVEASRHRSEAWTEEDRAERAKQRRQRNLAGLDRASSASIGVGVKRRYRDDPEYAARNAERMRELGRQFRVTEKTARDAICPRCHQTFRALSHREKYCPSCRPEAKREYQREWKRAWRARS